MCPMWKVGNVGMLSMPFLTKPVAIKLNRIPSCVFWCRTRIDVNTGNSEEVIPSCLWRLTGGICWGITQWCLFSAQSEGGELPLPAAGVLPAILDQVLPPLSCPQDTSTGTALFPFLAWWRCCGGLPFSLWLILCAWLYRRAMQHGC